MFNKKSKRASESPSLGHSKTSERNLPGSGGTQSFRVSYVKIFVFYINSKKLITSLPLLSLFHLVVLELLGAIQSELKFIHCERDYMGEGNVTNIVAKFGKMLQKLTHFNPLLIKRFAKSIIDLHVNDWLISCCLRYVVCNIAVKLIMNSDTGGIIIKIIRKVTWGKIINRQWFYH